MTPREWILITVSFVILGAGMFVSFIWNHHQANQIKDTQQALDENARLLNAAVGAACEIGIEPDSREPNAVHQLATGQLVLHHHDCIVIVRKLERARMDRNN